MPLVENITVGNKIAKTTTKLLLLWNPVYQTSKVVSSQLSKNCPHLNCIATHDKRLISQADAVLFEPEGLGSLPKKTKPGQVWIFTHLEPPPMAFADRILKRGAKLFNWTMTYRRDSDIPFYYGAVRPIMDYSVYSVLQGLLRNKTESMVWLVSHCKTDGKREEYYKKLHQHFPIDVIGRCGSNSNKHRCPRDNFTCLSHLLSDVYRFYFAAENSNCRDYISEKSFFYARFPIVVVVRGGGNYSLHFPKHSVMDVNDFSSSELLAKHLRFIASNKTLYDDYFKWRRHYTPMTYPSDGGMDNHFCQLCHRLHHQRKFWRVYENISTWWFGDKGRSGYFCSSTL